MNFSALTDFLVQQLHTHIRTYSSEKKFTKLLTRRIDLKDIFFDDTRIQSYILDNFSDETPTLTSINRKIVYATVSCPDWIYIIGPVCIQESPAFRYNLNLPNLTIDPDFTDQLFSFPLIFFLDYILLAHNLFHESSLNTHDCLALNHVYKTFEDSTQTQFSNLIFYNHENSKRHNPYEQERREMASIESGNLQQLKESWNEEYSGSFGIISKDPVRNGKYLSIIVIALATRAAIKGGILPEIALSLGDIYMQQVDEGKNVYEIGPLTKRAEYALTKLVQEKNTASANQVSSQDNLIVERCKDYVFTHLHEKITVQEIAVQLYLHPNYLSALFKKHEGISLYQYILNQKITLAKNLLTYSSYSFIEISNYLGFSSQSHLGKTFKRTTGFTLNEYRNLYGKTNDFTN